MKLVGKEIGPFAVEKELGSGAMGAVYLARYENGRHVALKFMTPQVGAHQSKAQERFEREFEILKQLKHPHIVRLIAHGKYQKMPFYAMEYVEGESLDRVLARRGCLPWEEVVTLGKQLCSALQHAHEQGIVHRDLKPSNLMLTKDGNLKLTDFGIAKDLDVTQLTSANCTVGTASYMSPEQCKGERNISHKSDLYSLGIVFYELLTGQKPFTAENAMDMFIQHVKGKFERPSRLEMTIPIWLDTVVCQLMEKKPEKRPLDAQMVSAALDQVTEKMSAQRSAGVDAVTSRTQAQSRSKATSEDREATRTLMQGLGKAKKRKSKPIHETAWFKAIGVALLLLAVGALIVVVLLPPSAETLFDDVKRVMESKDQIKIDNAYDLPTGAINRYLRYYGKRNDASTQQVRDWIDGIEADRRERALYNLMRINTTPEDELEAKARAAIRHEEAGEHVQAVAVWGSLKTPPHEAGSELRIYNRIADRHLAELAAVDDRFQGLARKLELARGGQEFRPESDSEAKAAEALRYQQFGDLSLAQRRWNEVKLKNERDPEQRIWFLLGARQAQDLKGKTPPASEEQEARLTLVKGRLAEAQKLARNGQTADALIWAREIQALYLDHPELKAIVKEARDLAVQLTPSR